MKNYILFISILFLLFSCKSKDANVDYILLSGKIENPDGDKVIITQNEVRKEILLNEDGSFADTLKTGTGYYSFSTGKEYTTFFASPGDNLHMTLNTKEFDESIQYSGNSKANSNYLAAKFLKNENKDFAKLYSLSEADFLTSVKADKEKSIQLLKNTNGLSDDFISFETKTIQYEYLLSVSNYPSFYEYFTKKTDYTPSDNLTNILKEFDYNNQEDFDNIGAYKNVMLSNLNTKLEKQFKEGKAIIEGLTYQKAKNYIAQRLTYSLSPSGENTEELYNTLMAISDKEDFKKALSARYDKLKKLTEGNDSPVFDFENYTGGTTKLEDLKGKYVYIDVWATWCKPCLGEIPALKEVEKKYHDKNIEFVSISLDTEKAYDTWKSMVKEKELSGVQLIADKNWSSEFVKDYVIQSIPRFILIDPSGKIINADAPRPSDAKLITLFNDLKI